MTNQDKEFMFAFLFFPIIIDFTEICTPNACIHVCIYKNATLNKNMGGVLSLIFRFIAFDSLWSNYLSSKLNRFLSIFQS